MMSSQMIRAISDDAAYRAAQEAREPLIAWPNDDLRSTPFLGEYVAEGWRKLMWSEVKVKPRNVYSPSGEAYFMVDASGMGSDYEPALTFGQLKSYVAELMRVDRRDIGIGIAEQGQFQIVMQLYTRAPGSPATDIAEPADWCEECQSSVECLDECESPCCIQPALEEDEGGLVLDAPVVSPGQAEFWQ